MQAQTGGEGNHRAVVGAQLGRRVKHRSALFRLRRAQLCAQGAVRAHATGDDQLRTAALPQGTVCLGEQYVNDRLLKIRRQRGGVFVFPVRRGNRLAHGGFQAAETEIQRSILQHRAWQREAPALPALGKLRQLRPARVRQTEHFGGFVEGFTGSVIHAFPQQPVLPHAIDAHELGVAAGDQQRHKGKRGRRLGQQRREQMTFEVMDGNGRFAQRAGVGVGKRCAHQQRPRQPGAGGVGDGIERLCGQSGLMQRLRQQARQAADVVARSQFRHHAAICRVQGNLRMQRLRQQPPLRGVENGHAGFITRTFDAQDFHAASFLQPVKPPSLPAFAARRQARRKTKYRFVFPPLSWR